MTISHHPSEETLVAFANASLCEANSLVVATHLANCSKCRSSIRKINEVAGALLEQGDVATVSDESRIDCIAKLDDTPSDVRIEPATPAPMDRPMAPLSLYDGEKWKWVGPGVYRRFINVPSDTGTRVFMLKAAPGTRLPDHQHVGTEWTCVLKGAYRHDYGRFAAGDFDEADDSVEHNPFVEEDEECICLVALNGHVTMTGWLGRLIQPLVRL